MSVLVDETVEGDSKAARVADLLRSGEMAKVGRIFFDDGSRSRGAESGDSPPRSLTVRMVRSRPGRVGFRLTIVRSSSTEIGERERRSIGSVAYSRDWQLPELVVHRSECDNLEGELSSGRGPTRPAAYSVEDREWLEPVWVVQSTRLKRERERESIFIFTLENPTEARGGEFRRCCQLLTARHTRGFRSDGHFVHRVRQETRQFESIDARLKCLEFHIVDEQSMGKIVRCWPPGDHRRGLMNPIDAQIRRSERGGIQEQCALLFVRETSLGDRAHTDPMVLLLAVQILQRRSSRVIGTDRGEQSMIQKNLIAENWGICCGRIPSEDSTVTERSLHAKTGRRWH